VGFYSELAGVVSDLLKPDASGGLGQGAVVLVRLAPGAAPANPWDKVAPVSTPETLRAAVRGVSKEWIGRAADDTGAVIVASDLEVIAAVPTGGAWKPGDRLTIDGAAVSVLAYHTIPAAGTPAAVRFIVRN
jgi:hypothetical protein